MCAHAYVRDILRLRRVNRVSVATGADITPGTTRQLGGYDGPLMGSLLERLRRRDPASLKAIVDENARRLYRAARGMGFRPDDAEDLVQDVFLTFLILHHKVQERRRMHARQETHDPIDEVFESRFDARGNWIRPPVDPTRQAVSREIGEAIRGCLEGLSPLQREVFQLRQVEQLSAGEVSKILGQTITHIGVLFHRARTRLRECLDGKGWNSIS
jgi:RNA polymerase sigma factor (sigma-70 family)